MKPIDMTSLAGTPVFMVSTLTVAESMNSTVSNGNESNYPGWPLPPLSACVSSSPFLPVV